MASESTKNSHSKWKEGKKTKKKGDKKETNNNFNLVFFEILNEVICVGV